MRRSESVGIGRRPAPAIGVVVVLLVGLVGVVAGLVSPTVAGADGVHAAWFSSQQYNPKGDGWIGHLATGDLNGDGRIDVVAGTDYAGGEVQFFAQNVQHGLDPGVVIDGPGEILRVADINGDARSDLVNITTGEVRTRLQMPDGTLAAVTTIAVPGISTAEVTDYTGDGRKDVVIVKTDKTVLVATQQPNGTLAPPISVGSFVELPHRIRFADLDGDAHLDMAGLTYGGIALRPQLPGGQLAAGTVVPQPVDAADFAFGDFNGDTRLDVATSGSGFGVQVGNQVMYRNPDLTWGTPVVLTSPGGGSTPSMIRTGDIDRDGKLDVVTIKSHTAAYVYFQGDGGIEATPTTVGHSVRQWASRENGDVADVNGDGWLDIVSGAYYGDLSVSINATGTRVSGISGNVVDANSAPLPGYTVAAFDAGGVRVASEVTDGAGHYDFDWTTLDPGASYRLRFTDPSGVRPVAWYTATGAKGARELAGDLSYTLGSVTTANLAVPDARSVTGRVQDGHHDGVQGLTIALLPPGKDVVLASATTASDGSFSITKLLPDTYAVSVTDGGADFQPEWWGRPGRDRAGLAGPAVPITAPGPTALGTHTVGATGCASSAWEAGAELSGAELTGCWRKGADLTGASLFLADMAGSSRTAIVYDDTTCPDGTSSDAHLDTCEGHLGNGVGTDNPVGVLDSLTTTSGGTIASGWAVDPNSVDAASVRVDVDGVPLVTVVADLPSPEATVPPLYGPDHGFRANLGSLSPGVHEVCVHALDVGPGSDVQLGCEVIEKALVNTRFNALQPSRILDTRDGTGIDGGAVGRLGPGASIQLDVTGAGGVPASRVGAVVLNVTATQATESTFVTVWPTLTSRPLVSNLNVTAGRAAPNLVIAKVGANGRVSLFNNSGAVHVLADVVGWFDDGTVGGGRFHSLDPRRVLDTRDGTGPTAPKPLGPGEVLQLQVAGNNGVALGSSRAVVLNVTATEPSADSFLTVYPMGTTRPPTSNLNVVAGQTAPNLVVAKLSPDGWIEIYNNSGTVQVIADLAGWFDDGTLVATGSAYNPLAPNRILDTRDGIGAGRQPLFEGSTVHVKVAGRGGVPVGAKAVAMNVTVTGASDGSFLTVAPSGTVRPLASNLNFAAGQTVPNLVVVRLSSDGYVDVFNNAGTVEVIADVTGWFA